MSELDFLASLISVRKIEYQAALIKLNDFCLKNGMKK